MTHRTSINVEGQTLSNATNVETKHLKVGDVSYAYRELRQAKLADPPLWSTCTASVARWTVGILHLWTTLRRQATSVALFKQKSRMMFRSMSRRHR